MTAGSASAGITRIAPSVVPFASSDSFLTIHGSDLLGTQSTMVVFDGLYMVEPRSASSTQLEVFVPIDVTAFTGDHTAEVVLHDQGGTTRVFGPVTFTVEVQIGNGPPLLSLPETVVREAEDKSGANVIYLAGATSANGDAAPIECSPRSGSRFPLGTTVVQCSATDANGTSSGGFTVFVTDTTPPELTLPNDIDSADPVVTFTATAVDNLDGSVPVSCSPASGSTFPSGRTRVRCTAVDGHFNLATEFFFVRVTGGPPLLEVPEDILGEEATSAAGAVVTYQVTVENATTWGCTPPSGSTFPLGTTTVTCTATNAAGTTTRSFRISVEDHTGPVLNIPTLVEAEATSPAGAAVTYLASSTDAVDGSRPVNCVPASGTFFAFGTTTVLCTSADTKGNESEGSFDVIVQDTTAPEITVVNVTPATLWPPNHQMVAVTVTAEVTDAVDPSPSIRIVSVSSNQPVNGTGDGDTAPDWVVTGPLTLQLRAERAGANERIYTITLAATDVHGNVGTATVSVRVADSKRRSMR